MFNWNDNAKIDIDNEKAIDKAIKDVVKHYNNKKGRANFHVLLVACVEHGVKNKDFSKLTNLFNLLPANVNKDGIKIWLEEYTSAKWLKNKAGVKMFLGRDADQKVAYTFELKGFDVPFYEMERVKANQNREYNFAAAVDMLFAKAVKQQKEGKLDAKSSEYLRRLLDSKAKIVGDLKEWNGAAVAEPEKDDAHVNASNDVPLIQEAA